MKLVIGSGTIKRQIEGPFAICGSRENLKRLADLITAKLDQHGSFTYGWIEINDPSYVPQQNTVPLDWSE